MGLQLCEAFQHETPKGFVAKAGPEGPVRCARAEDVCKRHAFAFFVANHCAKRIVFDFTLKVGLLFIDVDVPHLDHLLRLFCSSF